MSCESLDIVPSLYAVVVLQKVADASWAVAVGLPVSASTALARRFALFLLDFDVDDHFFCEPVCS